jgi:hypothetical protein
LPLDPYLSAEKVGGPPSSDSSLPPRGGSGSLEESVARGLREAAARAGRPSSIVALETMGASALAHGLSGPPAVALASLGRDALAQVPDREVGSALLGAIVERAGTSKMEIMAETVKMAGDNCLDRAAAVEVYREGLALLASPPSGRIEAWLAEFGERACARGPVDDARAMGQIVLQRIERVTSDPELRRQAHDGFEAAIRRGGLGWDLEGSGTGMAGAYRAIAARLAFLEREGREQALDRVRRMADGPGQKEVEVQPDRVIVDGIRVDRRRP